VIICCSTVITFDVSLLVELGACTDKTYSLNFFRLLHYNDSVRTSQETLCLHYKAAVCWENNIEHTNTLCRQNAGFWYVKQGGMCSNHLALKG
jgi:hypothetical protein